MSSTHQLLNQHTLTDLFTIVYLLTDHYLKTSLDAHHLQDQRTLDCAVIHAR